MKSFRKLFELKRKFKICLFEGEGQYWPIVDGWTQDITCCPIDEHDTISHYNISYFHDNKNYYVEFSIDIENYYPENFTGEWHLRGWGKREKGTLKSEKNIKNVLKKCDVLYEKFKTEAMEKIPSIPNWKRVVNDFEIAYSRKQDHRTVIVKIINHNAFIRNWCTGCKIHVYDDDVVRYISQEAYEETNRHDFKSLMSDLNDKFFKK